jgi:hypothetical protein
MATTDDREQGSTSGGKAFTLVELLAGVYKLSSSYAKGARISS